MYVLCTFNQAVCRLGNKQSYSQSRRNSIFKGDPEAVVRSCSVEGIYEKVGSLQFYLKRKKRNSRTGVLTPIL